VNFTQGNILLKEHNQSIKNKVKLHIIGVPVHTLGNELIGCFRDERFEMMMMMVRPVTCSTQ